MRYAGSNTKVMEACPSAKHFCFVLCRVAHRACVWHVLPRVPSSLYPSNEQLTDPRAISSSSLGWDKIFGFRSPPMLASIYVCGQDSAMLPVIPPASWTITIPKGRTDESLSCSRLFEEPAWAECFAIPKLTLFPGHQWSSLYIWRKLRTRREMRGFDLLEMAYQRVKANPPDPWRLKPLEIWLEMMTGLSCRCVTSLTGSQHRI